ncbi:uncharacterized protein Sap-r [Epargyreus clarus]|uniref:uncharacterized protein Sap-r n=1 Tax=Epargyreus clarus TaxID=520877 RepID=UPI003C2ACFB7
MTNALAVCLLSFFCLASLSTARQIPKECSKGPEVWCVSLKWAADCGAVGHCISTVWENEEVPVKSNEVSDKIVQALRKLKDVKDLISEDYLATSIRSTCRDVNSPAATSICKANTAYLETYLYKVLASKTTPETMCRIIGMCNNLKLDAILNKKKTAVPKETKPALLGASRCTWGPAYWCSNFSTGHECKATKHCAQRVWPQKQFPQDNDGICKICTDMVAQARDQLESNETQEELKEVFEGSCKLIPIKLVRKECIKLSDDFVPELVETLASQMNPQAVCSVAGLCNNAKIDKLIEDYNATLALKQGCSNCRRTMTVIRKKFDDTSYDDFLIGLLQMCTKAGSLSDSCSMLVFKYYENILAAVKKDLTPQSVCHLSSQCSHMFHSHSLYDFPDEKLDQLTASDDVPCEFCEQLVQHLRDTLIANTTEIEFHKVLVGLCKQTGGFKSECLQLVEQYHSTIYYFLVSELNPAEICGFIGICTARADMPLAPLLPAEIAIKAATPSSRLIGTDEANSYRPPKTHVSGKQASVQILGAEADLPPPPPLPVERMFVAVPQDPKRGQALCSFCEYFLHYLQVELSDERTEEAIRKVVENACEALPDAVTGECRQFVTQYGPAVIALLVQEIDPSTVCPALELCPKNGPVRHVAINSEKSNCPLCLFAVEQLETMLKNNRSEENIRHALDNLCTHLSAKLRTECVDFVDTYTKQLVEMLVADMDPQEICVFLKLCQDSVADPLKITRQSKTDEKPRNEASLKPVEVESRGDIETNEIPDHTVNGRPKKPTQKTVCVLCEFVMREIDDQIKDKHNDDEIKKIVHGVCKRMPKSVRGECDQFVERYADLVISLLAQDLDPNEVCRELKLCDPSKFAAVREEILDCAVCETVVMAVKKVLSNEKVDRDVVHVVEKSCALLPAKYYDRCRALMEIYGEGVIRLIEEYGTRGVCRKIGLCGEQPARLALYRENGH